MLSKDERLSLEPAPKAKKAKNAPAKDAAKNGEGKGSAKKKPAKP